MKRKIIIIKCWCVAVMSCLALSLHAINTHRVTIMADGCGALLDSDYPEGATLTLTPIAGNGYAFERWNDGNTDNPRVLTIASDVSLTALFTAESSSTVYHTITVNDVEGGSVTGNGRYEHGATADLNAIADDGFNFVGWSDGNTSNPRHVVVLGDSVFTPVFARDAQLASTYTLTVHADGCSDNEFSYPAGAVITLVASPIEGYKFKEWSDGVTDNPRLIALNTALSLVAQFEIINEEELPEEEEPYQYEIAKLKVVIHSPYCQDDNGLYDIVGEYPLGATVNVLFEVQQGDSFMGWSDGPTNNPRTITITNDAATDGVITLEALVRGGTTTDMENIYETDMQHGKGIRKVLIDGHIFLILQDGTIFDARGAKVK